MNKCEQCKKLDECNFYKMQNTKQGKFCNEFKEAGFNYEEFECIQCGEYYWLEINMDREIED